MKNFKMAKQGIREYMGTQYTDERLAMLLAHAQSGKLAFYSCCCFAGIPDAQHNLRGRGLMALCEHREDFDRKVWCSASHAYFWLSPSKSIIEPEADAKRRRILIPMIRAEMKRRDRVKEEFAQAIEVLTFTSELQATF